MSLRYTEVKVWKTIREVKHVALMGLPLHRLSLKSIQNKL